MNSRALTVAISLLAAAATGVALTSTGGCGYPEGCEAGWLAPTSLALGVSVDLHAVVQLSDPDATPTHGGVAVGAEGTIVVWGSDANAATGQYVNVSSLGPASLRALCVQADSWWVVGDAGTAAVSGDHGQTWIPIDLPTTADLRAIVSVGSQLVVAGDEAVLVQASDGTWSKVAAPNGGWGQLRALHHQGDRTYAVGLGGVIWSTLDPLGEWIAEASDTGADLFAIGYLYTKKTTTVVAVGAAGTVLVRKPKGWDRIRNGEDVDLVGYHNGHTIGANGELFEVTTRGKLSRIATLPGAHAMATDWERVLAVGNDGAAFTMEEPACDYQVSPEGRPFIVDGRAHTASLRRDDGWCDVPEMPTSSSTLRPELARTLAAAWAQDGLSEHASVASFARFALELLALGAPPRLVRDLQAAIADELRHARACFDLARRFGGVALGPGPLSMPDHAFVRVGDPIATAIGVFDEACVNESVAACAAAEAAACSNDPEVRRVLSGIAVDERRHAVAGWAALRWLLDSYGELVRQPLRARLACLHAAAPPPLDGFDQFDQTLSSFGRLSARDESTLRNRVLEQLVRPLARAMLFSDGLDQAGPIP
jgi:hypothetical protein